MKIADGSLKVPRNSGGRWVVEKSMIGDAGR